MDRRKTDRRNDMGRDAYVFDIRDVFDILIRRKFLLVVLMALVLVPGVLYIMARPSIYEATATAMMEEPDSSLADFQEAMNLPRVDTMTVDTQVSILMSPELVEATLKRVDNPTTGQGSAAIPSKLKVGTSSEPLSAFYQNFAVAPVGRSKVISVTFKSPDPVRAASIVNTHLQTYIDYSLAIKKEQIDSVNRWLNQQVEQLKKQSQTKGEEIQSFKDKSGIMLAPDAQSMVYRQITELSQQLVPIETKRITLQSRLNALNSSSDALPELMESDVVKTLKAQASAAAQEVQSVSAKYGASHPERIAAEQKLAQVTSDLQRETANIRASLQMELQAVEEQQRLIQGRIGSLNSRAGSMQTRSITMEGLKDELDSNRKVLNEYLQKFEQVKSRMDLTRADIRVINKAAVPTESTGPAKSLLCGVLLVFSVFFAIAGVLVLELLDRGIESDNDVKRILNLKLLGILPKTGNPLGRFAGSARTTYSEELRRIYLTLAARTLPQAIVITSAHSGEGKSTVALSLAQYMHSIDVKVVLVDADAITASLAALTGTEISPGFAETMAGAIEPAAAVQKGHDGLNVIPSGDLDRYHIDILAGNRFAKLIESLKASYDYVIVDCAPALSAIDAEVIASRVDSVILVINWAKTKKKKLKKVAEMLRQHAKDVPGVILNKHA